MCSHLPVNALHCLRCTDARRLVPVWAEALGYRPQEPPAGFASWKEWYVSRGVPADELPYDDWVDRLVDPDGVGPRILVPALARGQVIPGGR